MKWLLILTVLWLVWPMVQRFCLWLVFDSPWTLGPLAPWVFGIGVGAWPHKVKEKEK